MLIRRWGGRLTDRFGDPIDKFHVGTHKGVDLEGEMKGQDEER